MNGLIHSIGESYLLRGEAEMRGNDSLHRLALGVTREIAGRDAGKDFTDLGRASKRVLVEVQAQGIAAAEGRAILLHRLHAGARNRVVRSSGIRHGTSFSAGVCEWTRRDR